MLREFQLRAVAFPEGDIWVVQGVDYDVVAQAKDLTDAPGAFLKQFVSTMIAYQHAGQKAFEHIPAAPDQFREMFETAAADGEIRFSSGAFAGGGLPKADIDLRAYPRAA